MTYKLNVPHKKWARYTTHYFVTGHNSFLVSLDDCSFDEALERIPSQKALIALIDNLSKR
jgi:hypothetical protein